MKARVKATGEIVEVIAVGDYINENGQIIGEYKDATGILYTSYDLDFYIEEGFTIPDYWTRLEHQYAGMAMNAMLLTNNIRNGDLEGMRECNTNAMAIAHALIQKLKLEDERK